jgi:predicted 3-demethylubiquinone-9 3-methyltransferase (glyoxalase superfamily)
MKNITPCLWFDSQAEEAVNFFVSIFGNSRIGGIARYGEAGAQASGKPKGTVMTVEFELEGQQFMALNGGPYFTFSPAVSFFVSNGSAEEIDDLWKKLSAGGKTLMELGKYPFGEKYGWLIDRFGVSWQFFLEDRPQKIAPALMFIGKQQGKAEEAIHFYVSLFKNSGITMMARYEPGTDGPEGEVVHAKFTLDGQDFIAFDSHVQHDFTFTPAISFIANCETQQEVDELWAKLSEDGATEQCGWLKDKYGVSWQIVPTVLGEMMQDKDTGKSERVMKAMLKMVKPDIKILKQAYEQK